MTTKHTPGPWLIASNTTVYALQDTNPRKFNPDGSLMKENSFSFNIQGKISDEEKAANAKISSISPQMLEAIKEIYELSDGPAISTESPQFKIWKICNDTLKLLEDATGSH